MKQGNKGMRYHSGVTDLHWEILSSDVTIFVVFGIISFSVDYLKLDLCGRFIFHSFPFYGLYAEKNDKDSNNLFGESLEWKKFYGFMVVMRIL